MIACLDTSVLIWGVQGRASENCQEKVAHAKALLNELEANKAKILVPAPVVFELLLPVHPERHAEVLKVLGERFKIVPFNIPAAAKNAELWAKRNGGAKKHGEMRPYWPEPTKAELRFDCQIVSIALVNGASVIYSEDPHIASFAEGLIRVAPVPAAKEQLFFF